MNKTKPKYIAYEHKDKEDGYESPVRNDTVVYDQRNKIYYELDTDERKLIATITNADGYQLADEYEKKHPVPLSTMAILEENGKLDT